MKIKSTLIITLLLAFSSTTYSQVNWLKNEKLSKAIATEKDQLILMDFWAVWCGPCRKMDAEMWNTEEFAAFSKNFVPFKVDIDIEKQLARKFNIRSIPYVVLATVSGDIVWEQTGYLNSSVYKKVLQNLPESLNGINSKLLSLNDEFQDDEYFSIAEEYLKLALENDGEFKNGFLSLSDKYFREITKNSENNKNIALAEMKLLLNDAYLGRYKRAIRKVDKMEVDNNDELTDMKNFIKAYCFKCEGDETSFKEAKAQIKSTEYISRLENN